MTNKVCYMTYELNMSSFLDRTLVTWKTKPVDIELHPGAKPYRAKPYPVPRAHESVFRKEVELLFQIGLLKKFNCS